MRQKCAIVGSPGCGKTLLFRRILSQGSRCFAASDDIRVRENDNRRLPGTHSLQLRIAGSDGARREILIFDTPGLHDGIESCSRQREGADTIRLMASCDILLHIMDAARVGKSPHSQRFTRVDEAIYTFLHEANWPELRRVLGDRNRNELRNGWLQRLVPRGLRRRTVTNHAAEAPGVEAPLYFIGANKMDLPWSQAGYRCITEAHPEVIVIPLSARRGDGLQSLLHRIGDTKRGH